MKSNDISRWFRRLASNQVGDAHQGHHVRTELRPGHGRNHGEGGDDAVEAAEHLRHRVACQRLLTCWYAAWGGCMASWGLWMRRTRTMLLMYSLGVLLWSSGAPIMISRVGMRSPELTSSLAEEQLVVIDKVLVVAIDDEEPRPSCAALEAAKPLLAKASLARPRSRVIATGLVGLMGLGGIGTTPRAAGTRGAFLWRQGQALKNSIISLRTPGVVKT